MTVGHDELFLKLAIRQGFLSREDAKRILQEFRAETGPGEKIGDFVLRGEWMDEGSVALIEKAIAHRAPGHVEEAKKRRVPTPAAGAAGSGRHAPHPHQHYPHHHVPAQASHVQADPTRIVLISLCGIVFIGALIFMMFRFQSGNTASPSEKISEKLAEDAARKEKAAEQSNEPLPSSLDTKSNEKSSTPVEQNYTDEELKNMRLVAQIAAQSAVTDLSDLHTGRGLDNLKAKREKAGGDALPAEIKKIYDDAIKELTSAAERNYAEILERLKQKKENGSKEEIDELLSDIEQQCGSDYRKKAEAAIK